MKKYLICFLGLIRLGLCVLCPYDDALVFLSVDTVLMEILNVSEDLFEEDTSGENIENGENAEIGEKDEETITCQGGYCPIPRRRLSMRNGIQSSDLAKLASTKERRLEQDADLNLDFLSSTVGVFITDMKPEELFQPSDGAPGLDFYLSAIPILPIFIVPSEVLGEYQEYIAENEICSVAESSSTENFARTIGAAIQRVACSCHLKKIYNDMELDGHWDT
eukprot:GHVO01018389.1.p1 GENE.GHVO01018389.1~~GHVO01018389.1.p1  ORF type:complete len:221 (-),score=27.33 GHVO01018389.1:101-763(-)